MESFFGGLYAFWNQIVYAVSNIRVFDILDILVIALIVYKAIEFLRDSRAGQLVKGLIILLVAYGLATWWELAVLRWLLSIIVDSAVIALAVIFQPELRRILEKVGHTRFGAASTQEGERRLSSCIDEVCKAAAVMQEKKIGALIVFECATQLGEIINTGTIIDAEASTSMTNNIFFPKSPLHDGALIIREGRLYAAGCILPLSQSQHISSQLGTRHRAAIGMTENSDAIVLVVSEETGIISIVKNGEIKRNYNAVSANAELRRYLITPEERKENIVVKSLKRINPLKIKHGANIKAEGKADEKN
ncbi:MAG: TIGR00159 family protein [Ruminococcaceae bacterium]|nr:TIGR00159 family protein [Oscillospiraceae bacterium]